jgi:hypothetical protein
VRCGELFRAVSTWLHANWQDDQVPFWKRVARFATNQANRFIFTLNSGLTATGSRALCSRARAKADRGYTNHKELSLQDALQDDAELNWNINVQVGGVTAPTNATNATEQSSDLITQKSKTASDTIKFRVGLHPPETALIDANDPTSNDLDEEDSGMRLIVCFTLRNDISGTCCAQVARWPLNSV